MFYIQKGHVCYSVDMTEEQIDIKPFDERKASNPVYKSIAYTLSLMALFHSRQVHFNNRETVLIEFFRSKGYTIKMKPPDQYEE